MQPLTNFVLFRGQKIFYWIYGDINSTAEPLLIVHGGPGSPHNYLLPLAKLAQERPIIFYDQLGCGKSIYLGKDKSRWNLTYFLEELTYLITTLKLNNLHIFGHSWGSILASEYALKNLSQLKSLILASPCLSIPLWCKDAEKLLNTLPRQIIEIIEKHQKLATTDSDEYQFASLEYYQRYVCRLPVWPKEMIESVEGSNDLIYRTIWGESEFLVTGNIQDYDITKQLHKLNLPVLFTCGRYDEATPETTKFYQELIKGAKLVIFENSSHLPHFEEKKKYLEQLSNFLRTINSCQN